VLGRASIIEKENAMRRNACWGILWALLGGAIISACSSSDDAPAKIEIAENSAGLKHYGKTYGEWAGAWWTWFYTMPADGGKCPSPIADTSGELCGLNQNGDVFFFAGTTAGNAARTKCVVPRGKAILVPLIVYAADNAGVPPSDVKTEAQLKDSVEAAVSTFTDVRLKMDGEVVDTSRLRVETTKYSYTLAPEPNAYTCLGQPGVNGVVDPAFAGGYYALLRPPPPGAHEVEFGGTAGTVSINVSYRFQVE
jgi:hypothetical protein